MACRLLELDPPAANLSFVVGILSSFFYLISGGSERQDARFRELRPGQFIAIIYSDLLGGTSQNSTWRRFSEGVRLEILVPALPSHRAGIPQSRVVR